MYTFRLSLSRFNRSFFSNSALFFAFTSSRAVWKCSLSSNSAKVMSVIHTACSSLQDSKTDRAVQILQSVMKIIFTNSFLFGPPHSITDNYGQLRPEVVPEFSWRGPRFRVVFTLEEGSTEEGEDEFSMFWLDSTFSAISKASSWVDLAGMATGFGTGRRWEGTSDVSLILQGNSKLLRPEHGAPLVHWDHCRKVSRKGIWLNTK